MAEESDSGEGMKATLPERPARVLVAGDTHGDLDWWEDVLLLGGWVRTPWGRGMEGENICA